MIMILYSDGDSDDADADDDYGDGDDDGDDHDGVHDMLLDDLVSLARLPSRVHSTITVRKKHPIWFGRASLKTDKEFQAYMFRLQFMAGEAKIGEFVFLITMVMVIMAMMLQVVIITMMMMTIIIIIK